MNLETLYLKRFFNIGAHSKLIVWSEIARFIYNLMGCPNRILDPACGEGEFLINIDAPFKHGIDLRALHLHFRNHNIHFEQADCLSMELNNSYYGGVFVSNFLEHLSNGKDVQIFLKRIHSCLINDGTLVIIGPNYKYAYKEYYDFCDHKLPLTEKTLCEHLEIIGFKVSIIYPRFLPYTFKSKLPKSKFLVRLYLKLPFLWKLFGKQFLVMAKKV